VTFWDTDKNRCHCKRVHFASEAISQKSVLPVNGGLFRHTVLGLRMREKQGSGDTDKFITLLIEVRAEVRKQKLWPLSDLIRDRLKELGVTLEDGKDGTTWRYS